MSMASARRALVRAASVEISEWRITSLVRVEERTVAR